MSARLSPWPVARPRTVWVVRLRYSVLSTATVPAFRVDGCRVGRAEPGLVRVLAAGSWGALQVHFERDGEGGLGVEHVAELPLLVERALAGGDIAAADPDLDLLHHRRGLGDLGALDGHEHPGAMDVDDRVRVRRSALRLKGGDLGGVP